MNACLQKRSGVLGKTIASAVIGAALCAASVAGALPLYSGTTTGTFTAPVLIGNAIDSTGAPVFLDNSGSAITSGTDTDTFTWGILDGSVVPDHSTLQFAGLDFVDKAPDEVFKLGTLTFTNGTSFSNTLVFGITLTVGVVDANVTIVPAAAQIAILTTFNGNVDPYTDADFVGFDVLPVTFHVFEGATAVADVFGYIHGDPLVVFGGISLPPGQPGFLAVPEPSILAVLAIGLAGLGYARRRRKA